MNVNQMTGGLLDRVTGDMQRKYGENEDDRRLRSYYQQRQLGQGVPSADDLTRVKTHGLNQRHQMQAQSQAQDFASRGLSRSGMQNQATLDQHQQRQEAFGQARQDALAEAVKQRQAAELEGTQGLRQLDDRAQAKRNLMEEEIRRMGEEAKARDDWFEKYGGTLDTAAQSVFLPYFIYKRIKGDPFINK